MRERSIRLLTSVFSLLILACGAATAASGPQTAWNVFTLPNPEITPNWRIYVSADCKSNPEACAQDHRFWEEWDFSNFQSAIDTSFAAVNSLGKYQAVMMIMPLGDTPAYWNNIQLMYQSAMAHGVQLQAVLFPNGNMVRSIAICTTPMLLPDASWYRARPLRLPIRRC